MGRYLQLAKRDDLPNSQKLDVVGRSQPESWAGEKKSGPFGCETRHSDLHSRLAYEALRKIEHPDLPGMIRWLEKANPALYNTLQKDLLNQIDLLWQQGVPIDEFQEILDHWVKVHLQACHLYAQAGLDGTKKEAR